MDEGTNGVCGRLTVPSPLKDVNDLLLASACARFWDMRMKDSLLQCTSKFTGDS